MADFIIRPDGDADWTNAVFLSGTLPITNQNATALGLTLGANYQIGEIGTLATFSVTNVGGGGGAPTIAQQLQGYNSSDNLNAGETYETSAITIGSGANRMLIAAVATGDGTAFQSMDDVTATFGAASRTAGTGTAMTGIYAGSDAANRRRHVIFFAMPAPPTGAGTVQVTVGATGNFGANVRLYELTGADQNVLNIVESTPVGGADVTSLSPSVVTTANNMLALTSISIEPQAAVDISPELVANGLTEDARGATQGTVVQNSDLVFGHGHDVVATAGASAAGWSWTTAADGHGGRIAIGGA